jgi:hypothetical protein
MDGAVISIDTWDVVPLTSRPQTKDDGIQHSPSIDRFSARLSDRIKSIEQRLSTLPQGIGHFPQRGHGSSVLGHRSLLSRVQWPFSHGSGFEMKTRF